MKGFIDQKNEQGLRKLEQIKLIYVHDILDCLKKDPSLVSVLSNNLEISNEELYDKLGNVEGVNISFYDQSFDIIKSKILKSDKFQK